MKITSTMIHKGMTVIIILDTTQANAVDVAISRASQGKILNEEDIETLSTYINNSDIKEIEEVRK